MGNVSDIDVCRGMGKRNGGARLQVDRISTYYGEAQALKDVSLDVRAKEVVAILGSNGAGKSTLVKTLTGLAPCARGEILFDGRSIRNQPAHEIIRNGIACVPEGRELFGALTVKENLELGAYSLPSSVRRQVSAQGLDMVFSLFPVLRHRLKQKAETLSGGEQQMLALGRALMANPKLLACDEPSLGLAPLLVSEMLKTLRRICDELEVSLLLVEQNARAALRVADYVYVLERGRVVLEGGCQEVISSPTIQTAYLGG